MKNVILFVFNNYRPDVRVSKEAISLKNVGYNTTVVAYHKESLKEFEEVKGVNVHRIRLKSEKLRKIRYFEYVYKAIKLYRSNDIFHCNDLNTLPIGVIIKLFFNRKAKVVYDAHEFEINQNARQSKTSIKVLFILEKFLIKYADVVFTVSNSIADEYAKMYPFISKPTVLFNAPLYSGFKKTDKFREDLPIKKDSIILLYQGYFSRGRMLGLWLEAFKQRKNDKVVIVFLGSGDLEEEIKEAAKNSNNIFYHSAVAQDILLEYTAAADVGVSYVYASCLSDYYGMPNKFFQYAKVGLPSIIANVKDMGEAVRKYNLGVITKDDTPEAINDAIDELLSMDLDELRQNALQFAKEYCWEEQEKKMLEEYKKLES